MSDAPKRRIKAVKVANEPDAYTVTDDFQHPQTISRIEEFAVTGQSAYVPWYAVFRYGCDSVPWRTINSAHVVWVEHEEVLECLTHP